MINSVKERLQYPAIGLMVIGAINALFGILVILVTIMNLAKGPPREALGEPARLLGYQTFIVVSSVSAVLTVIVSPVIVYGAAQMLRAKKYSLAKLAAILAVVPCTSLCCVIGVPVGVWALVLLNKPDVRAAFYQSQGPASDSNRNPIIR